jgi:hypothetical protein
VTVAAGTIFVTASQDLPEMTIRSVYLEPLQARTVGFKSCRIGSQSVPPIGASAQAKPPAASEVKIHQSGTFSGNAIIMPFRVQPTNLIDEGYKTNFTDNKLHNRITRLHIKGRGQIQDLGL